MCVCLCVYKYMNTCIYIYINICIVYLYIIAIDLYDSYHPSMKFTSKCSREWIEFLDVEIIKEDNPWLIDVVVKSTDTHQYFHATSFHVYHSKKFILYSQALHFNKICSKNQLFHKRCNNLEVWLKNRDYNEKLVRQQVLKARKYRITELLYSERDEIYKNKLVLNIILFFRNLRIFFSKIHLPLTPDRGHSKVFENIPVMSFKKGKILKDILVRTKAIPLKTKEGLCGPYNKPRCEFCKHITKSHQFESTSTMHVYSIRPQNLNSASKNEVYLFTSKNHH